mmetsp:Transcript_1594/g.4175  ORF Transcript_1594/g.4175 Transcript_1594/m.4175 type:complete len:108 (+) Transcript_1594:229-552(+)
MRTSVRSVSNRARWPTSLAFCCCLCLAAKAPAPPAPAPVAGAGTMTHDHSNKHENEAWRHLQGDKVDNHHEHNHISKSQQLAIANVVMGWFGVSLCLASCIFVGCWE